MHIGVLNELLNMSFSYYRADGSVPEARVQGDPLKGEELVIHWQQMMEKPLFLTVSFEKECFVQTISSSRCRCGMLCRRPRESAWLRHSSSTVFFSYRIGL